MTLLLTTHSFMRWLILIVAFVAIIKFALGWWRGEKFKSMDRGLASGFSGLMDLQATIGLVFLVWSGLAGAGFPMAIAAVVGHLSARWKNAEDKIRFRNSLFIVLDVLILVFIGVMRLPAD